MSKGILVASAVVLSAAVAGGVYAQAPNFQPKANTNPEVRQTDIQSLNKEIAGLKQQVSELNKQVAALKKAFQEHTHTVNLNIPNSPISGISSADIFTDPGFKNPLFFKNKDGNTIFLVLKTTAPLSLQTGTINKPFQ